MSNKAEWESGEILVGDVAKNGQPWWSPLVTPEFLESVTFDGPIPVGVVADRLFGWDAVPVNLTYSATVDDWSTATTSEQTFIVPNRSAWIRSDRPDVVLGLHSGNAEDKSGDVVKGYQSHGYRAWLLDNVSAILGDTLHISSAGMLDNGAVAWVEVGSGDTLVSRIGDVKFRPYFLATTSLNGKVATTYARVCTIVVCENTWTTGVRETRGDGAQAVRVKHTSQSARQFSIPDARSALGILERTADDMDAELSNLLNWSVSDSQWRKFLDAYAPIRREGEVVNGATVSKRAATMANTYRDRLTSLYANDVRVAPWKGTGFGVLQAVDTDARFGAIVRNVARPERVMAETISGGYDSQRSDARRVLASVCN